MQMPNEREIAFVLTNSILISKIARKKKKQMAVCLFSLFFFIINLHNWILGVVKSIDRAN